MYDEVIENHKSELLLKQQEMDEEIEACNRMYQARMAETETAHAEKIRQIEKRQNESENNSWNWERATSLEDSDVLQVGFSTINRLIDYSYLPNKRVGPNNRVGGKNREI